MAILNKNLSMVVGFRIAPKYSGNCVEYTDKDCDRLPEHVVCRGFESHFRYIGIAQGLE